MEYRASIDRLLTLVDHERGTAAPAGQTSPRQKQIFDLARVEALLGRLGNPQDDGETVHVAGTKGKGSTAALCDSVLRAAGFHTGFYSSPHLHSFRERVRLDSSPITEEHFASLVEEVWPHQEHVTDRLGLGPVTLFEFMTAMGFRCFSDARTDFRIVEVGLGGRLDATNVLGRALCIITSISLDHTAILGDTLAEIAREKAGIVKPGCSVVVAPQPPEALEAIEKACRRAEAVPVLVGRDVTWEPGDAGPDGQDLLVRGRLGEYPLTLPLLGAHQLENAAAAVGAVEVLRERGHAISDDALARGFAQVSWPCRLEVLSKAPLVVVDGAHNTYSVETLLASLRRYLPFRRLLVVAGFSRDKSVEGMAGRLAREDPLVFACSSRHPRSLPPGDVAALFHAEGLAARECSTPAEALTAAIDAAEDDDLVLAVGSLFVAAEVREAMLGIEPEVYPELLPPDPATLRRASPGLAAKTNPPP